MTPRQPRSSLRVISVIALVIAAAALQMPTTAWTYDSVPCGSRVYVNYEARSVQYCRLWRGNVPVHEWPNPSSAVIGWLVYGGWTNWFYCQQPGSPYFLGAYANDWWAYTRADNNNKVGWVSEVYFSGGGSWEPDGGLIWCSPGV